MLPAERGYYSTGLGKTELVAEVDKLERITCNGDYIVLHIATVEPVKWKSRPALTYKDVLAVLRSWLKPSIITFLLYPVRLFKPAKHPDDF